MASGRPRCGIGGPKVRHRVFLGVEKSVSRGRKGRLWGSKSASPGVEKCTVGAYEFNMCKNKESSATAGKGGPAAGGQSRGETLSKQVLLGKGLKERQQEPTTAITLGYGHALSPVGSVAGFKGLRPPAAGPLPWILECGSLVSGGL